MAAARYKVLPDFKESFVALRKFSALSNTVSLRSIIKHLSTVLKYFTLVLLFLNARSLPLVWHLRIFCPLYILRFQYYLLRLRTIFNSRSAKEKVFQKWFESMTPIGTNPFRAVSAYQTWASIDDSDFNGHLSNSSYAKTNDAARSKLAFTYFPSFFRAGGWVALGATHYQFIREIPMLHKYEVRQRIVGWDNKWLFIIGRFVSHVKVKTPRNEVAKEHGKETPSSGNNTLFQASTRTPADGLETPATPANTALMSGQSSSSDLGGATDAMRAIAAAQLNIIEEADGATLNCVSISQVCFKHGRITVPPGIVLAVSGFCAPPPPSPSGESTQVYSRSNPPPHYPHVQNFISPLTTRKYAHFLRGGWRDVPDVERWWVEALGGVVEDQRRANVESLVGVVEGNGPMGLLKKGMDDAKSI